jgi:extracellular elastinolytic metalloproteinase
MFRISLISLFSFLLAISFAQPGPQDIALLLDQYKKTLGISTPDMAEYSISSSYTTAHLNITHVYLEQRHLDIRVFNGILNLNLAEDRLVSFGNRWISGMSSKAPSPLPGITPATAVRRSAAHLGHAIPVPMEISKEKNKHGQDIKVVFASGNLSREDIEAELIWLQGDQKNMLLCWKVQIAETDNENIWSIFIDAHTGAYIRKDNLVIHCSFDTPSGESMMRKTYDDFSSVPAIVMPPSPDSSYNVFAMPVESPNHGTRSVAVRPWLSAGVGDPAITLGWHNNGATNFTSTRGNNVHAYEDMDNNNAPGYSPDTFNLRFDYPFVPSIDPTDNLASCITNLFYWNNIIHDVMYQYGFDEVSGNFQNNNLGRGGLGADYVKAEAQDGGGTNNANFSTPVDGSNGRMQMYIWSPVPETSPLTINSPPSIAGSMFAVESAFSANNKLENIGLTTDDLVLVQETGGTHLACGTITNAAELNGKIAVMDRGACDFVVKVKNVQNQGAVAAIVINNVSGDPFAMGGTDNTIVIPAVMISLSDGNDLKTAMNNSVVNASLDSVPLITPDGDFDNGIITHEYGHGISTRLTGGPANSSCLNNQEQMGEGWSDFFGLMLTTDWTSASATERRGIGTYVLGQSTEGTGIRTYPYTIDTTENPFTYADVANAPLINGNPSVHYIGSVWCTMLWDMAWNIIELEGVDPDIYDGDGGNNIALQLVIDGLKLQPCNPGFVDGRDAILLADELNYGGQYKCAIWNAFAGRGLGVDADQGSSNDYNDGVESFALPNGVRIESTVDLGPATEGQEVTFSLKTTCECVGKSDLEIVDVLSDDLIYMPGSGGTLSGDTVKFAIDTLGVMDSVVYTYRAFVRPCSATETVILSQDNAETPDQYISVKLLGNGTKVWVKNTTLFVSPTRSWYGKDYNSLSDFALTLNDPVFPSGGPVEISFYHRYETEAYYDGGVVEYSFNDGATWNDAGPYFIENGYPASIYTAGTNSPIAGQDAFTGNSDVQFDTTGFIHSTIALTTGGSEDMLIRFRFVCDGSVGGPGINGWYIDNIFIRQLSGLANQTRVTEDNNLIDSLNYSLQTDFFEGEKIYVDSSATGELNGISWPDAMHELSIALGLADCRAVDSVFITEGTYLPNLTNDREGSFVIPDSTSVFGGFPEGGSTFALRNPENFLTILSGDLGISGNSADNVYHVLKVDSAQHNVLLDGVTLSHGHANGNGDNSQGAAVFCLGGLTMQNVIVNHNTGFTTGQLFRIRNAAAHLKLKDCTIFGPNDSIVKLLNSNAGQVTIQGNTRFFVE